MRAVRGSVMWLLVRATLESALREAVRVSREEPHKVFWVHAMKCPGCNRHTVGLLITCSEGLIEKPKYVLATVTNGEVIPRGLRH